MSLTDERLRDLMDKIETVEAGSVHNYPLDAQQKSTTAHAKILPEEKDIAS